MATVINLNKARKHKVRAEAARQAAENRLRFGRSKAEKLRDAAATAEAQRKLDRLKRDEPSANN